MSGLAPLLYRFDFGVHPDKESQWIDRMRRTTSLQSIAVRDLETGLFFTVLPGRAVYLYDNQGAVMGCAGCRLPRGHLFACGDAAVRGLLMSWKSIESKGPARRRRR